ncbi:MAG TPA: GNAT family N-acetyltransferase [Dermatophilaceae bacterium]|nr:GNAT family N-acetyltransferase [Dermatophilaceae bacterium]
MTDAPTFVVSSDPGLLDRERVHRWICDESYWAAGRPVDTQDRAIDGSRCYAAYRTADGEPGEQVGFARVVTDGATFAWLCDVYVDASARGLGVGSALVEQAITDLGALGVKRILLATRDAHEVYARQGFTPLAAPDTWMERDVRRLAAPPAAPR